MNDDLFNQAVEKIRSGDKAGGRQMLLQVLKNEPYNDTAWLWLAETADNGVERLAIIQKCLQLNPGSQRARRAYEVLNAAEYATPQKAAPVPTPQAAQPAPSPMPQPVFQPGPRPTDAEPARPEEASPFIGEPVQDEPVELDLSSLSEPAEPKRRIAWGWVGVILILLVAAAAVILVFSNLPRAGGLRVNPPPSQAAQVAETVGPRKMPSLAPSLTVVVATPTLAVTPTLVSPQDVALPEGARLLFSSGSEIVYYASDGKPFSLKGSETPVLNRARLAPDGKLAAFLNQDQELWVINVDGTGARRVIDYKELDAAIGVNLGTIGGYGWTPDSASLVVYGAVPLNIPLVTGAVSVNLATNQVKRLAQFPTYDPAASYAGAVEISPDGNFLLVSSFQRLQLIDLRTGKGNLAVYAFKPLAPVNLTVENFKTRITWLPDGTFWAAAYDGELSESDGPVSLVWVHDGKAEFKQALQGVIADASGAVVAVSPDGKNAAYSTAQGIQVVALASGQEQSLAAGPGQMLSWSPDGSKLAYALEKSGLWVVGLDGSPAQALVPGAAVVRDLHWVSPDLLLYRVLAGKVWDIYAQQPGQAAQPVWPGIAGKDNENLITLNGVAVGAAPVLATGTPDTLATPVDKENFVIPGLKPDALTAYLQGKGFTCSLPDANCSLVTPKYTLLMEYKYNLAGEISEMTGNVALVQVPKDRLFDDGTIQEISDYLLVFALSPRSGLDEAAVREWTIKNNRIVLTSQNVSPSQTLQGVFYRLDYRDGVRLVMGKP